MPDLIGTTLGGYRITEQIGLGGMATVFKAFQPSMDRYVALKVISTHLTQDPTFVKRFRQEAKVITKLEHLHILPVYDHGEEDGYLYLVMRFIKAGTLKDRLARGPLTLDEARRIESQVGHFIAATCRPQGHCGVGARPDDTPIVADFVLELDARFVSGERGLWGGDFQRLYRA